MTSSLTAEAVIVTARTAGLDLTPETALRIATAVAPALDAFAPVSGTLPLDLEPATFLRVQRQGDGE
ncbi:hypothetical protein [Aquabacter cavernae]|uniref:hypothetical protein n=1 Tax=Aquabacter cavernae TaxID=2496029 RepID=UPI000F8C53D9|nr:hypothetical protein [Aquabacter cavernae]